MYDPEDTHLCIKCNSTIIGLEEYIHHRKSGCAGSSKSRSVYTEHAYGADEEPDRGKKDFPIHNFDYDLGADFFFQSLELQSSNKKPTAKDKKDSTENLISTVSEISGPKKIEPAFPYFISDDESEESEVEYDNSIPPRTHTGGKWKPENRPSSRALASASWEHAWDDDDYETPPPEHTKGKWIPGSKITKLEYDTTPYWCSFCSRQLASKPAYDRHLKSNMHSRRTQEESELETLGSLFVPPRLDKREVRPPKPFLAEVETPSKPTKRFRRRFFTRCDLCKTRMPLRLLGKHLISHYHYRRMQKSPKDSYRMILENMPKIVVQAPFQCNPCKFYSNTQKTFFDHWYAETHFKRVQAMSGSFLCSFCRFQCESLDDMSMHLEGSQHQEVVQVINRTVPIVVHKIQMLNCEACKGRFRFNIELKKHRCEVRQLPEEPQVRCSMCQEGFKSLLSLQRHEKKAHDVERFYCSVCEKSFGTAQEAKSHRRTTEHKTRSGRARNKMGDRKTCGVCKEEFQDILELKEHIRERHPEVQYSCPHCGAHFVLPQERSRHVRDKSCNFFSNNLSSIVTNSSGKIAPSPIPPQTPSSSTTSVSATNIDDDTMASGATTQDVDGREEDGSEEATSGAAATTPNEIYFSATPDCCSTSNDNGIYVDETLKKGDTGKCKLCSYGTSSEADMIFHKILHTIEQRNVPVKNLKIECPFCRKLFPKASLQCHLKIHTNERQFQCKECSWSFARLSNLKDHVKNVHQSGRQEDEKPLYCCSICGKNFRQK